METNILKDFANSGLSMDSPSALKTVSSQLFDNNQTGASVVWSLKLTEARLNLVKFTYEIYKQQRKSILIDKGRVKVV